MIRKNLALTGLLLLVGLWLNAQTDSLKNTGNQASVPGDFLRITRLSDSTLYRHHISFHTGFHLDLQARGVDFSPGFEYEYRGMNWAGIGLQAGLIFTDTRRIRLQLPLSFHPFRRHGFSIYAGPALYFYGKTIEEYDPYLGTTVPAEDAPDGYHFGFGSGISYKMYLDHVSVALRAGYLHTDLRGFMYGVSVGYALSKVYYR